MAKQDNLEPLQAASVDPDATFSINAAQLMDLFKQMNASSTQSAEVMAQTLANAVLEARKPYVDPRVEENDRVAREQTRQQMAMQKAAREEAQANCPHIAGCNSLSDRMDPSGLTSIIWHRSDVGSENGVCTNCIRVFRPTDPDYRVWRVKKSFNKLSRSGDRYFTDPLRAQELASR